MRNAWLGIGLFTLVACVGSAPPNQNNPDGGNPPADGDGSGSGSAVTSQKVSGKVFDYFSGDPIDTAAITTDGLTPAAAGTSAADGAYSLDIAVGSKLYATVSHGNYRTTRSAAIAVADQPVAMNLYAYANADVQRQYASVGVTAVSNTIIAADMQDALGAPLAGVPLAGVTLVDAADVAVPGINGPFFYGALGDLDSAVVTSTAYGTVPRARVAFLNVPIGTFTLKMTYMDGGVPKTVTSAVIVDAGGATLALVGGVNAGTAATMIADPSFATDIYPRLQKASKGGLGCGNCHTANGPAAVLKYDDADPAVTLAAIKAAAGVINTTTPATSLFLVNPLYETTPPQNHPNATFLDVNDPNYKLFLLWITNGTKP